MARAKKDSAGEEQDLLEEQSESSAPESSFSDDSDVHSEVSAIGGSDDSDVSHAAPTEMGDDSAASAASVPGAEELVAGEDPSIQPLGDNLQETEGLLRDVPAPLVVELTRLRMNTSQVIRLKQGQILRLPRSPSDPVNLVVNGKLFARAELVDVDGEIGVRLLELVGSR